MSAACEWAFTVPVDLKGGGGFSAVRTTLQAAVLLTSCWPVSKGPAFIQAVTLVPYAFRGEIAGEAMRVAFTAAAKEAGVLVQLH
ncbi:hypothetical protein J2Y48_004814 [Mycoplana sp. BE70]|uniref:DUF982 domain-containing protein n=1 Tax=Mycoplana sp. BE70 TaxID=2817775 RepID=UPI0028626546|nr:hypothetical protein [Mycoplana sp. BE70]